MKRKVWRWVHYLLQHGKSKSFRRRSRQLSYLVGQNCKAKRGMFDCVGRLVQPTKVTALMSPSMCIYTKFQPTCILIPLVNESTENKILPTRPFSIYFSNLSTLLIYISLFCFLFKFFCQLGSHEPNELLCYYDHNHRHRFYSDLTVHSSKIRHFKLFKLNFTVSITLFF